MTVVHTKLAVSIPHEVFEELVRRAREEGLSRSAYVAQALREYFEAEASAAFVNQTDAVWESLTEEEVEEIRGFSRVAVRDFGRVLASNES